MNIDEPTREDFVDSGHFRAFKRGTEDRWLIQRGFDGLWNRDGDCACKNADLYPCGGRQSCEPGIVQPCPADCAEHDWHIGPKPVAVARPEGK